MNEACPSTESLESAPLTARASPSQERLWFLEQLNGGRSGYVIPCALRLRGKLEAERLQRAFDRIIARHEALRTTFEVDGELVQVIHASCSITLGRASDARTDLGAVVEEHLQPLVLEPFDLRTGPLLRARLVQLADDDHLLLVAMHHIVSDGWSMGVLARELIFYYAAPEHGVELPELPIQYADYAEWQRDLAALPESNDQVTWWRAWLEGARSLEFPTDHRRPAVFETQGASLPVSLSAERTQALKELAQREQATLFMALYAGWLALGMRYTDGDDLTVGTAIANRTRPEVEPLIGFFANTLALRTRLDRRWSFRRLLSEARETCLEAYAHQNAAFEKLVAELEPDRDLSRAPLFQTMLVLQGAVEGLELPELSIELLDAPALQAQLDLSLSLTETREGLCGSIIYARALFERATVERIWDSFVTLLDAALADSRAPIESLAVMPPEERDALVVAWNATEAPRPPASLSDLFDAQVEQTPDRIALVCGEIELTYNELQARACSVAERLAAVGVEPGDPVGLSLRRSPAMIAAQLGILRAGCGYVPLDPSWPPARLAYMLADSGAGVLVTEGRLLDALPEQRCERLCVDELPSCPPRAPVRVSDKSLAYILYTSGSTGQPKGIEIAHESAVALVAWAQTAFAAEELAGVLAATSISWDLSVFEIFVTLCSGGTVVLADSVLDLPRLAEPERVTLVNTVPSAMRALLGMAGLPRSVCTVNLAGEPLPRPLVDRLYALGHVERVNNLYGPSEDTTYSTWCTVPAESAEAPAIGRPVSNTRAFVLDRSMRPVPQGVEGELYLGGAGLARGYRGQPGRTAAGFVPDPFGSCGGRLYRTGDRVRHHGSELHFFGRQDHQVKVRGFRIELGDIEAALMSLPTVRGACVVVRQDASGEAQLVGYVERAGPLDSHELRRSLTERLPDYMVPSVFAIVDALPLTPSGKIDRKSLPEPEPQSGVRLKPAGYGDEYEQAVAELVGQVLGTSGVSSHASFFELGGHSLLATRLVSQLRNVFGVELPLKALFESPTVAGLAARVREASGSTALPSIEPGADLVLSFGQERLWFIDRLDPGDVSYHIAASLRLTGELDIVALDRALCEIVRRHHVIRTVYEEQEGRPVPALLEPPQTLLEHEEVDESELPARVRAEVGRPFDLSSQPALRARLFRFSNHHVLVFTMHHIASDGWSLGVLVREAVALYEAFARGEPSPLPEPELQYADYARWLGRWLAGDTLERQLSYWKEQLGEPPPLELPTDRPRPAQRTGRGRGLPVALSAELTQRLRQVASEEGATLFMVILAAFQLFLARHSGQDDIVVGSPIANRRRAELEDLVGFFVNTLAIRTRVSPRWSFRRLLSEVRRICLDAYAHQDVPFERIVQAVQPERDLSRTAIFQALFALQNVPPVRLEAGGLGIEPMALDPGTSKFDLGLSLEERDGGLRGTLQYATDLFEERTVERLWTRFRSLLDALVDAPDIHVSELALLSEEERREVLEVSDETSRRYRSACLHQLFEEQAASHPDTVALVFEDRALTFGELDKRANQLARRLRELGVGPDETVGIVAERSAEIVLALLGVMKAGAAYLPIEPTTPAKRLAAMLEDADVAVAITCGEGLPVAMSVVDLSRDWHELSQRSAAPVSAPCAASNTAYVLFTSGSTGRPKGVAIEHRQATNYLFAVTERLELEPGFHHAMVSTFAADLGNTALFPALCLGGTLHVISADRLADPEAFSEYFARCFIDCLKIVPSHLSALLSTDLTPLPHRRLVLGGEATSTELLERIMRRRPSCAVFNHYGPTETTVGTVAGRLDPALDWVPLGRPLGGTQVVPLDRELELQPLGVPGELCVSGHGVTRGYVGRPDLTAERFVPSPFVAGGRMYRTGDLGRQHDGMLEFLGRLDHQVKIRGFRIELGEVQAVIASHPEVRDCVVVAKDERLVAYVAGASSAENAIRVHLAERIPEYMVPSAFVMLDALPLTPNGKVDRKALPEPAAIRGPEVTPPRTGMEQAVAAVFAEVLELDDAVGAHDSFFALGGHSLLATRAVSRLRRALGVELPLRALFEEPTVAGIAGRAESVLREGGPLVIEPIATIDRDGELPLSFGQERLWFLDQLEPDTSAYNMPAALRFRGPVDRRALEASLAEVIERHEVLRTTFATVDGRAHPVIHPPGGWVLPWLDLSPLDEATRWQRVSELALEQARTVFDLAVGPLFRAQLLRVDEQDHVLLVTMHHIVSDGWSVGVMAREVAALYDAFVAGRPSPLAPLELQYVDYAASQRGWLKGETLERQLDYWRKTLGGAPRLDLSTDRPRLAAKRYAGAHLPVRLSAELGEGIRALSRRENATPFMTLLAAFALLLGRTSRQRDVVVGTPIANRRRIETEGLIGFFVNMLALRVDLTESPSFRELVARVKEVCLGAYAHQDVPFERVVDEVEPERDLSRTPIFQVAFVLQNARPADLAASGVDIETLELETGTSKFDLTLTLTEGGPSGLEGHFEYDTDLFERETIERMTKQLERLLAAALAEPDAPISRLPLLEARERHALIDLGAVVADFPVRACLHERFETQVDRSPDAVAVSCDEQLSYAELDRRANQLARQLRTLGVDREALVGIYLDRTPSLVVAILATLKAGGAYVPLDPAYPPERIGYMLEDAAARVVLTTRAMRDALPAFEAPVVCVDEEREAEGGRLGLAMSPDQLAYVIYTSGSTGKPKGVGVSHRNAMRLFDATEAWYAPNASDVWTLFHSSAFDFSVWELWGALLYGGRLVVVPYFVSRSPDSFCELLAREQVTMLNQTPSAFWQLVAADAERRPSLALRHVIFGGEALELPKLRAWFERHGDRAPELVNMYGITETTVHVSYRPLSCADVAGAAGSAIGGPIPDLSLHVLDEELEPVPLLVPGEMLVGGAGPARGYLNRPDLTAQRFVPDPFATALGARLYRSGDLARRRAGGDVEYLGRIDQQVKIRGFRIELGEIESALAEQPGVRASAVVVRQDTPGHPRLVAYMVLDAGTTPSRLRAGLETRLPSYMVPSAFVSLERLPLTPNGKLDARALPKPDERRRDDDRLFEAPSSPAEHALAQIWSAVLRVERIGRSDSFFELGGDSILSLQVVARARQAGWRLTPRQVFEHTTLRALAAAATPVVAEADQGPVCGPVALTPIQRWLLERQDPIAVRHYNQALLLEVHDEFEPGVVEQALEALVSHHDMLRARYTRTAGRWSQEVSAARAPSLERLELGTLDPDQQRHHIETVARERQGSLNLETGEILRVVWFDLGPREAARMLVVVHHLVIDGVSWRILLEDLWTAFELARRGAPVVLPPKSSSFQRWADRLAAGTSVATPEIAFWRAQLESLEPLPVDGPDGANTIAVTERLDASLDEGSTRTLMKGARAAYRIGLDEVLATAVAAALQRWTGRSASVVAMEGHGREHLFEELDVSRTVGWFTTIYPVRLELPMSSDPGGWLRAVKASLRAVPRHGIGYGLLRYGRDVPMELAALPEPEVSLNYLGQLDRALPAGAPLAPAREERGPLQGAGIVRAHLLDVAASVLDGCLHVSVTFSRARHRRATIDSFMSSLMESLAAIAEHVASEHTGGIDAADFPELGLDQAALEAAVSEATKGKGRVTDVYRLSPLQSGILFHTLQVPESYALQFSAHVHGALNPTALRRAWQEVLDHHAVLRTAFAWKAVPEPLQLVIERVSLPWREEDWRTADELQQARRWKELLDDDRAQPFALDDAPMMRVILVRFGEERWGLVWTHHHLLLDGWSLPLLLGEVMERYRAVAAGRSLVLREPRPYRDFIRWLESRDRIRADAFWRNYLAGIIEPTPLGIDRPATTHDPGDCERRLDESASSALAAFTRRHHVTASTVLQAAWAVVLSRYAGRSDVVFGTTVSGRSAPLDGIETMLGPLINTLPTRVRLDPAQSVLSLLTALQAQQAEQRAYEHTPLWEIQPCTAVPRGVPLFESVVVFENYPEPGDDEDPERFAIREPHTAGETNVPLAWIAAMRGPLSLRALYDAGRFDHGAIAQATEHVLSVIEQMVGDPESAVSALVLSGERARLEGPAESLEEPAHLPAWFARIAAAYPDAVAVDFGGTQLSYRELERASKRLAGVLRQRGIGTERIVALFLNRSIEMVIAILAVLEAGGAYLPIDPSLPDARVAWLLDDAEPGLILSERALTARLHGRAERISCVDDPAMWNAHEAEHTAPLSPEQLAYVLYTSGSTGTPKAVTVPHRGVCNLAAVHRRAFRLGPGSRVLQFVSPSFDVSVSELFMALLSGATLCLADHEALAPTGGLRELLRVQEITTLSLPASLLGSMPYEPLPAMSALIVGGETPSSDVMQTWSAGRTLFNAYGPTEATVSASMARYDNGSPARIGQPLANVVVRVSDATGRAVSRWMPGELHIGGIGVSRGYLDAPDLTAARFVPDPEGPAGARMYVTGDRVRWVGDGGLEFLGRVDDGQVKIRGLRIELGEIEEALRAHPAVTEAAAVTVAEGADRRIVAYAVVTPGSAPSRDQLRVHAAARLPPYMVPSAIELVDALARTSSGKLDRAAMARWTATTDTRVMPPRDELEQKLLAWFERVLDREGIGIDHDFFALGGHSLRAMALAAGAERELGVRVPVALLWQHPTVARLAEALRVPSAVRLPERVVPLHTGGSGAPLFLVHALGGQLQAYRPLVDALGDQPIYGLLAAGLDGAEPPHESIDAMVRDYADRIDATAAEGPLRLGGWSFGGVVACALARELSSRGRSIEALWLFDPHPYRPGMLPEILDEHTVAALFLRDLLASRGDVPAGPDPAISSPVDRLLSSGLLPEGTDPATLQHHLRVYRAHLDALRTHDPKAAKCPVIVLRPRSAESVPAASWAGDQVEVLTVSGDHYSMISAAHAHELAAHLRRRR